MYGRRKVRTFTVSGILSKIMGIQNQCHRNMRRYGNDSYIVSRQYKRLISLCNSLAIVFSQYKLEYQALDLLKLAQSADMFLYDNGDYFDKLWPGRLVTFNNFAYMFARTGDYTGALKFIFDGQSLIASIQKTNTVIPDEILVATNMFTFQVLWRIKQFAQAKTYIMITYDIIRNILKDPTLSFSHPNYIAVYNLYGLVVVSISAVNAKLSGNYTKALDEIKKCYQRLYTRDLAILKVIEDCIYNLEKEVKAHEKNGSDTEQTEDYEDSYDWLFTRKYESLSYIAVQFSFIIHVSHVMHRTANRSGYPQQEMISKRSLLEQMTLKLPQEQNHYEEFPRKEPNSYREPVHHRAPSRMQPQKKYKFTHFRYPGSKKKNLNNHTVIPLPKEKVIFNSPELDRHMLAKKKHLAKDPVNNSFTGRTRIPNENIMLEFTPDKVAGKLRQVSLRPFMLESARKKEEY